MVEATRGGVIAKIADGMPDVQLTLSWKEANSLRAFLGKTVGSDAFNTFDALDSVFRAIERHS